VSELTGLNLADMEQKERVLRVRGKGNKEAHRSIRVKAQDALENYWPLRVSSFSTRPERAPAAALPPRTRMRVPQLLRPPPHAAFRRRIVKKYVRLVNVNWDLHPHSMRHAFATISFRRRRPSRHSGTPRPPIALYNAKIHARFDPPAHDIYDKAHPHA